MAEHAQRRTAALEHAMAVSSAKYVFRRQRAASLQDVMRATGLCELRARRAIRDLVKRGILIKMLQMWAIVPGKED